MKKIFKIKNIIIFIIVAIIAFLIISGRMASKEAKAEIPSKYNPKTQTLVKSTRQDISESIIISGSVDAEEKAELKFQTSGQLSWIGVKVGDKVKKYQSIASLNKDQLKKQLEISYNNYKNSINDFKDTSDDYKDTIITDEIRRVLDRSQNSLNNSVASYELTDLSIKYSNLFSPIAGIVVSVDQPNAGVNVSPANNIASIINPQSVYFRSKIDQEDVNKIKVGISAKVKIDSYPEESIDSKVTNISFTPIIGESSTVYQVKFELNSDNKNSDLKYRLGMDGDAKIILSEAKNVITLPLEAVYSKNDSKYVLVKTDDNKIIKKDVKTGIESDIEIEITEGLNDNESVIIKK